MGVVIGHVSEAELADRRARGLDRWDEMWDGALHMSPSPNVGHQRILSELLVLLYGRLAGVGRGTLLANINVFRPNAAKPDYRIPDLMFVSAVRQHVLQPNGVTADRTR